jgi:hypothetical protein
MLSDARQDGRLPAHSKQESTGSRSCHRIEARFFYGCPKVPFSCTTVSHVYVLPTVAITARLFRVMKQKFYFFVYQVKLLQPRLEEAENDRRLKA